MQVAKRDESKNSPCSVQPFCDVSLGQNSETRVLESDVKSTDDKSSQIQLSQSERTLAKQWMLTETDWLKYKQIMKGPRGIWSPGIDPLTALGVEETNPAERRRYAEIWLKVETKRAELELAFEMERSAAAKKLLSNQKPINNTAWVNDWNKNRDSIRKIVHLFVDVSCMDKCKEHVQQIYGSIGKNAQLDIFFKDGTTSDQIGKWAAFMGIPPDVVKARKVTLNFDNGKSAKMAINVAKLPAVKVLDVKTGKISSMDK